MAKDAHQFDKPTAGYGGLFVKYLQFESNPLFDPCEIVNRFLMRGIT